jgi:CCR4-NOT transcription complex subunit 3
VPKNPYPTPPFYPQAPVGILETPAHFAKYDVDTLFYIFYYQVGTYMQCVVFLSFGFGRWRAGSWPRKS